MGAIDNELVVIGEIPVRIIKVFCYGTYEWYGLFPDNTFCCTFADHESFDEALECAKRRVAEGSTFKRPIESSLD